MERRWWLLGALIVIAVAAGFGIGSAVKSTSAPAQTGSLAAKDAGGAGQATVARPGTAVPVPPLKTRATATHTTSTSTTTSGAASATAVTTATTTQTFAAPPVSTTASPPPPSSTTHTSSGGGGGANGGG